MDNYRSYSVNSKKSKLREVIFFLVITFISLVFPALFYSLESSSFIILALTTILRNLGLSFLVFWFLKVRGEPFSKIGWTKYNLKKYFILGVALFPLFYFSVGVVLKGFTRLGLSHLEEVPTSLMPHGAWQIFWGGLLVLVVAFAEEIIFRGYLLVRIEEITESTSMGVLLSTVLFSLGHVYEGSAGMVTVAYIGLIFCRLFLWQKSLTTVIVLHFFTNFVPVVVTPILEFLG